VIKEPTTKQGNRREAVRKIMTKNFKKEILVEQQMVTQVTVLARKSETPEDGL
jgi:hypothetical protein